MLQDPGAFALRALKAFRANQGLLLAGAVAYYALLSTIPLLILVLIGLSHVIDQALLFETMERYLGWLFPGEGRAVLAELRYFVEHREVLGWLLLATLIFFSSLAFTVLENAMSIIFHHRVKVRRRHFLVSAILPYCYILFLGAGVLAVSLVAGALEALGSRSIDFLGRSWSLGGVSGAALYLLGVAGEILIVTSVYLVMPVGRLSFRHALLGGAVAALLWEATRHFLVWYYARLSQIGVVYGSLATAIVVLLSLEIGAALLLFGAQVISEYERARRGADGVAPLRTG
ncbi:MAG TPA: YihY/virulence factor BrkB family protein [Burkholderiales bacterium]|jgi:YihY family inner membrane protein|nr:YihY/virulence factor BrkB family protein [Burkholderiales bacterium]